MIFSYMLFDSFLRGLLKKEITDCNSVGTEGNTKILNALSMVTELISNRGRTFSFCAYKTFHISLFLNLAL